MNKKVSLLMIVATCVFGTSCSDNSPSEATPVEQSEEAVVETVEVVEEEDNEPDFIIPSALQISTIFKNSGLTFMDNATNSPEKVSDYHSKFEKLLNFGVYSGDLFYCILNDQSQLSIQYLKSIRQLSDETGMSGIFNTGPLFERFESNIGNKDSVINIMLEFQEKTDVLIAENNEEHTAMIIFTGAWVEGMYIGLDAARTSKNEMLRERMVEQMSLLPNLMKGLEIQPNRNEQTDALGNKLSALNDYFQGIEGVKGTDEYSYDASALTDDHFVQLYEQVKAIRMDITKNN